MAALYLRPDADQSDGNWLNESTSNTNLFNSVDEATTPSDTDHIQSATDGDKFRLRLSDPSGTVVAPLIVRYRCKRVGTAAANLIGRLYQGTSPGTLITTWTQLSIPPTFTTFTETLTSAEFASITDFTDLYVEFELSQQPSLAIDLNFASDIYYDSSNASGTDSAHLLLHMDGADASTTFIDATGRHLPISVFGNAQVDTAQSKFGGASALFDGLNDWLTLGASSDFIFGTGDFTIDCWIRLVTLGVNNIIYSSRASGAGVNPLLFVNTSDKLVYQIGGAALAITGTTSLTTGVWYHVALARSSSNTKLFLNGTQEGSTYSASDDLVATSGPHIGQDDIGIFYTGWIDEFRVLKGTAAWTTTFTPPTAAYNVSTTGPYTNLSCSRASIGYATNSDGTLTRFASNLLRIGVGTGLLVEDARTNYCRYSQSDDLSETIWISTWYVTDSQSGSDAAPDGTLTALKLVMEAVDSLHILYQSQAANAIATGPITASVYMKAAGYNWAYLAIETETVTPVSYSIVVDLTTGAITDTHSQNSPTGVTTSTEVLANGWIRARITLDHVTTNATQIAFASCNSATPTWSSAFPTYLGDGSSGMYWWGAQVEAGAFPSSYIPTTSAAATRALDAITSIGNFSSTVNLATASAYGEVSKIASAAANTGDSSILERGTGFDSVLRWHGASAGNDRTFGIVNSAASDFYTLAPVGLGYATAAVFKQASAWDGSGRSIVAQGGTVASDAVVQGANSGSGNVGSYYFTTTAISTYIRRLTIWNTRLADATLQGFTNP